MKKRLIAHAAAVITAIGLPFALVNDPYLLGITNFIIIYSILCLGLNLILGYAGLLSLGHAAFYGLGGYATAILMTRYGFWISSRAAYPQRQRRLLLPAHLGIR
jgi:ABC-type branched-subunit amino acid transport system permease subunit